MSVLLVYNFPTASILRYLTKGCKKELIEFIDKPPRRRTSKDILHFRRQIKLAPTEHRRVDGNENYDPREILLEID